MIYRGTGFIVVVCFGSLPVISRLQFASLPHLFLVSSVELTDGKGAGGGRGAKSYDGEKAWSIINH
jgi:hypothetical protein